MSKKSIMEKAIKEGTEKVSVLKADIEAHKDESEEEQEQKRKEECALQISSELLKAFKNQIEGETE